MGWLGGLAWGVEASASNSQLMGPALLGVDGRISHRRAASPSWDIRKGLTRCIEGFGLRGSSESTLVRLVD